MRELGGWWFLPAVVARAVFRPGLDDARVAVASPAVVGWYRQCDIAGTGLRESI